MHHVSTKFLKKAALYGAFFTLGAGMYMSSKIQARIQQSEFFEEAIRITRGNSSVVHLLGEPIRVKEVDLGNIEHNFCTHHEAEFEVPILGPKKSGILHFCAKRKDVKDKWDVYKIDLELDDERILAVKRNILENEMNDVNLIK